LLRAGVQPTLLYCRHPVQELMAGAAPGRVRSTCAMR
jgi:hypothetical protein